MCTNRCFYCNRFNKKMLGDKCLECLKEFRDIKDMLNNKPKKDVHYENNVIQLRMVAQ